MPQVRLISKDRLEALSLASDGGSVSAMVELGGHYLSGSAGRRQPALAELLYRRAAALGDADAIFHLGNMYLLGDGVPKDEVQALGLFEKAAAQGHPLALQNFESLRTMIEPQSMQPSTLESAGKSSVDEVRAIKLARQYGVHVDFGGDADPTNTVALKVEPEPAVPESMPSIPLAEIDQNALEDEFQQAEKYYTGPRGSRDEAAAITLYRRAARGGHPQAIERLLSIYKAAGLVAPRCGNINVDDEICF